MSNDLMSRLKALREYHVDAACRLLAYADDADMRKSGSEHYRKRAAVHTDHVRTLDEALNADSDGQVMGRVYTDGGVTRCELNSVGRVLPDHTPLYVNNPIIAQEAINRAKV